MKSIRLVFGIVALLALAGCGKTSSGTTGSTATTAATSGTTATPLSGTVTVTIENFAYSPATFVVKKGTILDVTNKDLSGHSLTADDGSFDTGVLGKSQKKTLTMTTVGTFKVHCTPHPSITGTITVIE